jgi:hypothetical protein
MVMFLNPNHSFADSGISSNDHIATVSVEQMNLQVERF